MWYTMGVMIQQYCLNDPFHVTVSGFSDCPDVGDEASVEGYALTSEDLIPTSDLAEPLNGEDPNRLKPL